MCNDNYNMDNPSITHGISFDSPWNKNYNKGQPLIIPWFNFGLRLNHELSNEYKVQHKLYQAL